MTDDPFDRLDHLAPRVDAEGALQATRTRATARRRRTGAAISLTVAVVVGATAVGLLRDGDDDDVVTIPVVTTLPTTRGQTPVVTGPSASADSTDPGPDTVVTATNDGLELTVTVHAEELVAGERTRVDVQVRNISDGIRAVGNFGDCGVGGGGLRDTSIWSEDSTIPLWDLSTPLDDLLRAFHLRPPQLSEPGLFACPGVLNNHELQPSEVRRWSGALDVLVGPQRLHTVPLQVRVSGTYGFPDETRRSEVSVEIPLRIVDPPGRLASYDDAIAAFSSSQVVADLASGEIEGGVNGSYLSQVGFASTRGMWQVTLAGVSPAGRVRLQYDPAARGTIVDPRIIPSNYSGENDPDPDTPRPPEGPHDIVLAPR